MPFSSFNPKPMKVSGMIQGGIGLDKFTSQESGNRTPLSGVDVLDGQLAQTIRLNHSKQ
jgi:hypothetical protein